VVLLPMRPEAGAGGEELLDALRIFHPARLP
jgi:hypothetical protein